MILSQILKDYTTYAKAKLILELYPSLETYCIAYLDTVAFIHQRVCLTIWINTTVYKKFPSLSTSEKYSWCEHKVKLKKRRWNKSLVHKMTFLPSKNCLNPIWISESIIGVHKEILTYRLGHMQYVLLSRWSNFDTGFTEHLLRSFVTSAPFKSALHEDQV